MEEQIREQMLLTPTANLASNGGSQPMAKRKAGGHGPTLADQLEWELPISLLPTPVANDDNKTPAAHLAMKDRLGGRTQITSQQVLAKAGFEQPWESTNRQSLGGKPSPVPPPNPLTNEDG